jgi:hypothetical protein
VLLTADDDYNIICIRRVVILEFSVGNRRSRQPGKVLTSTTCKYVENVVYIFTQPASAM